MRSRTSCEVAEEAKENWLFRGMSDKSSGSPDVSSGIEVAPQGGIFKDLGGTFEEWWWWWECGGGARALETSKAEALHDLERNSIGTLGLSGKWVPPVGKYSCRRGLIESLVSMYVRWSRLWIIILCGFFLCLNFEGSVVWCVWARGYICVRGGKWE